MRHLRRRGIGAPFIGVLIATLPACSSRYQYQSIAILNQTGFAFALIYFLEGYIIKPLIFKESMNLNPLMTIVMVMALEELLGFWGIMLALPIARGYQDHLGALPQGDFGS